MKILFLSAKRHFSSVFVFAFLMSWLIIYVVLLAPLPSRKEILNFKLTSLGSAKQLLGKAPPSTPVRLVVPLKQIAPVLQKAVIISEDDLFYQHHGINYQAFYEAFKLNWRKKRYVRGASTITMQLARNAFLTKQKTILRKLREIILARRIENVLSKKRILELYLNIVEWGKNIYGAQAAAYYYFGKPAAQINLDEAALLAALLPNPIYFNPYRRPKSCKRMQKRVLWLMKINHLITPQQYQQLLNMPLRLRWNTQFLQPAPIDQEKEKMYLLPLIKPAPKPLPLHSDSLLKKDTLKLLQSMPNKVR